MTMLEKVAEAIARQMAEDENTNEDIARAALMAIREPSEEMRTAWFEADLCGVESAWFYIRHQAAIDAILTGEA
jgi:hypothetical protein